MTSYAWNPDQVRAYRDSPTGLSIALAADVKGNVVSLTVTWGGTGAEERSKVGKYIANAASAMGDRLIAGGWRQVERQVDKSSLHFEAEIDADTLRADLRGVAQRIDEATEKVRQLSS